MENLPGDINGNGTVDLADAILCFQVLTGISPSENIYKESDVNWDNKVGMEEVFCILQMFSLLR
jgi:hypothetical protein